MNLGVDVKEVAPTSHLKDQNREIDGNSDFSNKDLGATHASQQQYVAPQCVYANNLMEEENVAILGLSDQLPSPQGLFQSTPSPLFSVSQLSAALPSIGKYVVINQISAFGMHFPFQRVVPLAMDRAIKEVVSGIVQRSVCIACQTTKEIVLKEPLRTSILGHLQNSFQGLNVSNELLNKLCNLSPLTKVVLLSNRQLQRKQYKQLMRTLLNSCCYGKSLEKMLGPPFFYPNMLPQNSVSSILESLGPKPGHLSLSQQRVYEDFVQHPWQKQSSPTSHGLSGAPISSGDVALGSGYGPVSGKGSSDILFSAGNAPMDMVSRPSDISVDGFASSPFSLLSSQVEQPVFIFLNRYQPQNLTQGNWNVTPDIDFSCYHGTTWWK